MSTATGIPADAELRFPKSIDACAGRCDYCHKHRPIAHVRIGSETDTWFLCRPCIAANRTDDQVRAAVKGRAERLSGFSREAPGLPYPELTGDPKDTVWCFANRFACAVCGTEVLGYWQRSRKSGSSLHPLCALHWEDYPTHEAVDALRERRKKRGLNRWGLGFDHDIAAEPWRRRVQAALPRDCLFEAKRRHISVSQEALSRGMSFEYWVAITLQIRDEDYPGQPWNERPFDNHPYPHAQSLRELLKPLGLTGIQIQPACPGPILWLDIDAPFFLKVAS